MGPVAHVGPVAQVAKGSLRGSLPLLDQVEGVGKVNQKLAVARPLARGEHHDAAEVSLSYRLLLHRKITYHVEAV